MFGLGETFEKKMDIGLLAILTAIYDIAPDKGLGGTETSYKQAVETLEYVKEQSNG